ncbi:MAG: hypothetical protein ACK5V3_03925 [Bdellovibrionales bacterium]
MHFAKIFAFFVVGYLTALGTQKLIFEKSNPKLNNRSPSALDQIKILSWAEIKCLPQDKLEKIYLRVQLQEEIDSAKCDDSVHGRLNQFFSFLEQSKLQLKDDKWGDLAKMFNDPLRYFESYKIKLYFDFAQAKSYAQASKGEGVWLGKGFFDLDPITATALFLHETYHHDEKDPGHTRCKGGDIPQTSGGCDEVFTLAATEARGAYSITVAYLFAQALENKQLSQDQKNQLLKDAFGLLSSRFVSGFEEVATLVETLAFLDLKGQIWIYHPWLKMVRQIPDLQKTLQKTPATQLQFHHQKQGLFAILNNNKLFEWSYSNPLRIYYPDIIPSTDEIMDATRLYLSSQEYAYTSVMKTNRRIYVVEFNNSSQRWELLELDPNTDKLINPAKQISTYDFFSAGVLDEAGDLWRISKGSRGAASQLLQEALYKEQNQKYQTISGGLYTDQFLGVTKKGELYQRENNQLKRWTAVPNGLEKVSEGFLNYYAKTDEKQIWFWPRKLKDYSANKKTKIFLPFDAFDFSVVRRLLAVTGNLQETTEKVCGHKVSFNDPYWPDMAWALDGDVLLMGPKNGSEDDCRIVRQDVKSARLIKRKPAKANNGAETKLRPVDLEIQFTKKPKHVFESWSTGD